MGLGASSPNRVTTSYVRIILTVFPYVTFTVVVIVRRLTVHGWCRECNGDLPCTGRALAHMTVATLTHCYFSLFFFAPTPRSRPMSANTVS